MVLASPGPLLTPPPSSSPPKTPNRSYTCCLVNVFFLPLPSFEQHKFIVLVRGMKDIMSLSKLNLLNVSMQTQSLPFSMLKVLVNATLEVLKREWIELSAPPHPKLASEALVTGG